VPSPTSPGTKMPKYKYLEVWDSVSCMNDGLCSGEKMINQSFEGKTVPRITASDSNALLAQTREYFSQSGVSCEFVKTGECELARFLVQKLFETTAQIRIESL